MNKSQGKLNFSFIMDPGKEILEKYAKNLEYISCNLCGRDDCEVLCRQERFGLDINTVICKKCGLIYLNPRPIKAAYAKMNEADYRVATDGTDEGNDKLSNLQYGYFKKNIAFLCRKNIHFVPERILDIGCSCGGGLKALSELYPNAKLYGLEPLLGHARYTEAKTGAKVVTGLFEDWQTDQKFDIVLFSKALNHTLDPKKNLQKIRDLLSDRGVLILVVHDPLSTLVAYPMEHVCEILHPFMFYREALKNFLNQVGFDIVDYHDKRIFSPEKNQMRKTTFSKMVAFAKRNVIVAPDLPSSYKTAIQLIRANNEAREKYGHIYHRWQKPTFAMRMWRKAMKMVGKW